LKNGSKKRNEEPRRVEKREELSFSTVKESF